MLLHSSPRDAPVIMIVFGILKIGLVVDSHLLFVISRTQRPLAFRRLLKVHNVDLAEIGKFTARVCVGTLIFVVVCDKFWYFLKIVIAVP